MHYFHNFASVSGGFAPRPHRGSTPEPRWRTFVSRPPNLPTPGKNPAGPIQTLIIKATLSYTARPEISMKPRKIITGFEVLPTQVHYCCHTNTGMQYLPESYQDKDATFDPVVAMYWGNCLVVLAELAHVLIHTSPWHDVSTFCWVR